MAVATPVLERSIGKESSVENSYGSQMTADEIHNARIKDNYAKIFNTDYKMSDLVSEIERSSNVQPAMQAQPAMQSRPEAAPQPVAYSAVQNEAKVADPLYLVHGARADSDLFRADSDINRAFLAQYGISAPAQEAAPVYNPAFQSVQQTLTVEEESDDARPTRTTSQYRTIDASGARISDNILNAYREGEIPRPAEDVNTHTKLSFTKRDKIIMGVVLGLILAVFVLIIVNSAIISGLSADVASLDGDLLTAQQELEQTVEEYNEATSFETIRDIYTNGMAGN